MTGRRVLVLYNEPRGSAGAVESDAGVLHEVAAVCGALTSLGVPYRRAGVHTLQDVGRELQCAGESCVINLVESLDGSGADACLVPAVCTALGKAWTGSGTACQLLALDKWQSKCALRAAGVPVPAGVVIPPGMDEDVLGALSGPVILKPLCTDASEGIDAASVIREPDRQAVRALATRIHADFRQPALVEAYVEGREFNVSILERDGQLSVLPLAEIDFSAFDSDKPRIVDYRAKWVEDSFEFSHTPRRIPADVEDSTAGRIRAAAVRAWTCLGCRQYARIDMRIDADGMPFVIEVNPNPDISPGAGFAAALEAAGLRFADFVEILIRESGVAVEDRPTHALRSARGDQVEVRWTVHDDKPWILSLIEATGVFQPYEVDVAREVLDEALAEGQTGHYQSYTALHEGTVTGWVCFGPTPCTAGTFDLYWLAVSPAHGRQGIGAALVARAEEGIRASDGRLIVVETSSRPDYEPARWFYERHGYRLVSSVTDFYRTGDDKLTYVKSPGRMPSG